VSPLKAPVPKTRLQLIACPTCRDSVWVLSMDEKRQLYLECATCPPAPAVPLDMAHLHAAQLGLDPLAFTEPQA
jgi:uncharacterized protein YbaR (Trm112 family)